MVQVFSVTAIEPLRRW